MPRNIAKKKSVPGWKKVSTITDGDPDDLFIWPLPASLFEAMEGSWVVQRGLVRLVGGEWPLECLYKGTVLIAEWPVQHIQI